MNHNKLAADPSATVLGIIALVISITLGCCGLSIIGLILSIIGLVIANKSLREYSLNPEIYLPSSRSNVSTGRVLNIIALILNSLITLAFVAYFVIYGAFMYTIFNQARDIQNWEDEYYDENGYYYDETEEEEDIFTEEDDSLYYYQDSIEIDTDSIPVNERTE